MTDVEQAAEAWIAGYFNARHLLRTRDWLVWLDPGASEAARVAALTHDIERRVPGGPRPPGPASRSRSSCLTRRAH